VTAFPPSAHAADGPAEADGIHLRLASLEPLLRALPPLVAGRTRSLALRACGVRLGYASGFWGMPTLIGGGRFLTRLVIGEHCGFNQGCFFDLADRITIGDQVSVGHDVMFLTRTYKLGTAERRAGPEVRAPIVIESGVWLGARATVMPGVTIGAGSVIGASVVVATDVPPNTLVMGLQRISLAKWRVGGQ
jgi:acetyltransferase-like isoleucine patch superfamily enzyme